MIKERIEKFCKETGITVDRIVKLKGDLSERKIFRISSEDKTYIAVSGKNIDENRAYLDFSRSFKENGFNVPEVYGYTKECDIYILEDLGDMTVNEFCRNRLDQNDIGHIKKIYKEIIGILPEIQIKMSDEINYTFCYQNKIFDEDNLLDDILRFEKYFLRRYLKKYNKPVFSKYITELKKIVLESDNDFFLYRDFQTRNMMLKNGKIYFLDFQSGRKGPLQYDLASFIFSSGTVKYNNITRELCSTYLTSLNKYKSINKDQFIRSLPAFGLIRIMQAMGNYSMYYYERSDKNLLKKKKEALNMIELLSEELNLIKGF